MVPNGWRKCCLQDVAHIQTGVAKGKRNIVDPIEKPYLRVANVQDGHLDLKEIKLIEVAAKDVERFSLQHGDIVLTAGGDFDKLGRGTIWQGQLHECLHQNHIFAVRVDRKQLLPEILAAQINSDCGKVYFLSCAKRSTKLASINSTQLKQFPVLVPPICEQQKIADILSTWDAAIEKSEALLDTARTQKSTLMRHLFTGKHRFPEFAGHPLQKTRLGDAERRGWIELSRGKVISRKDIAAAPGEYPVYSSSVVGNGQFGRYAKHMFDEELITWSVDGGGHFFHRKKHKFSVTNVCGWMRVDTGVLDYAFMAFQLQYLHKRLRFNYQSKAHPSVIRNIYDIVVPSLAEQQKAGRVILDAEEEVRLYRAEVEKLRAEKKTLMQQLVTGKRRVKL